MAGHTTRRWCFRPTYLSVLAKFAQADFDRFADLCVRGFAHDPECDIGVAFSFGGDTVTRYDDFVVQKMRVMDSEQNTDICSDPSHDQLLRSEMHE